ncbi:unnamed protein product [Peniophora sp. CBMAI 1063]|nr:unnamed protein product [Peniophora sp. CBMAI 1063]
MAAQTSSPGSSRVYITARTREGEERVLRLDSLPQTISLHSESGLNLELAISQPTATGGGSPGDVAITGQGECESGSMLRGHPAGKRGRSMTPAAETTSEATRALGGEHSVKRARTEQLSPPMYSTGTPSSSVSLSSRVGSGFLLTDADADEATWEQAVEAVETAEKRRAADMGFTPF